MRQAVAPRHTTTNDYAASADGPTPDDGYEYRTEQSGVGEDGHRVALAERVDAPALGGVLHEVVRENRRGETVGE